MKKTKLHLVYSPEGEAKIEIAGHEISKIVSGIQINIKAGELPKIFLEIYTRECEVDTEGKIYFSTTQIPNKFAKNIYKTLKERFKKTTSLAGGKEGR